MIENGCDLAVVTFYAAAGGCAEVLLEGQHVLHERGYGGVSEGVAERDVDMGNGVWDGVEYRQEQALVGENDGGAQCLVLIHSVATFRHA